MAIDDKRGSADQGPRSRLEAAAGPGGGFGEGGYGSYGSERSGPRLDSGYYGGCNAGLGDDRRQSEGAQGPITSDEGGTGSWSPATSPPEHRQGWQRQAITAGDIMTSRLRCASRDTNLLELARIMSREGCGVVPVVGEHGRLEGVVTDRDLVVRAAAEGLSLIDTRASEIMTDEVQAVTPDEDLDAVISLMGEKQIRRIPVVDHDDRLLGIVSMGDVATRADRDEELQAALTRISAKRGVWAWRGG
jgi:CBS domain-containing protein